MQEPIHKKKGRSVQLPTVVVEQQLITHKAVTTFPYMGWFAQHQVSVLEISTT